MQGIYGGRKPLSRAFRNRFIEISIPDLPHSEIQEIVVQSCGLAPKYGAILVNIMKELQILRHANLFLGKHGAVTTRDIIKCGKRQPNSMTEVANQAYMLLAEKLRQDEEKHMVETVIAGVCNMRIDVFNLYDSQDELQNLQQSLRSGGIHAEGVTRIGITRQLRRIWSLLSSCLDHNEPGLLVGETSSGKTTACQLYAATRGLP